MVIFSISEFLNNYKRFQANQIIPIACFGYNRVGTLLFKQPYNGTFFTRQELLAEDKGAALAPY
jgi:hypothetical protein